MTYCSQGTVSRISDCKFLWSLSNHKFIDEDYFNNEVKNINAFSNPLFVPILGCTGMFKLMCEKNVSLPHYFEFGFYTQSSYSTAKFKVCILNHFNEELYTTFIEKSQKRTFHFIEANTLIYNRNSKGTYKYDYCNRYIYIDTLRIQIEIEKLDDESNCELSIEKLSTSLKSQALDQFETLLNNQELSDVKFIVNGEIIHANKLLLVSRSSVFSAMFKHQMKEAKENVVEITDTVYEVMLETLRFIYTGKVNELEKYSKELLAMADKYNLDGLTEMCALHLIHNMTFDNVIEYLNLADLYNVQLIKEKAIKFIIDNGEAIKNRPDFNSIIHLRKDILLEVINAALSK